jgi:hypothetical protein
MIPRLPEILAGDVTRASSALATHLGPLTVEADDHEVRLYREPGHLEVALLHAAGTATSFCGSGGAIWSSQTAHLIDCLALRYTRLRSVTRSGSSSAARNSRRVV